MGSQEQSVSGSEKVIDMKNILHINETQNEYVLRYCASELSIPKNVRKITTIFGSSPKTGHTSTFNNCTGLPYGFSYEIKRGADNVGYRKIEHDIIIGKKFPLINEPNYLYSYQNFVDYYFDEKFLEPYYEDNDYEEEEEYDDTYDENEKLTEEFTSLYSLEDVYSEAFDNSVYEYGEDYEGDYEGDIEEDKKEDKAEDKKI